MKKSHIPKRGEFPFPLPSEKTDGHESAFVAWIRNHSSYLTVGTLSEKTGNLASFVWGTVTNALILAPFFLFLSLTIGYFHFHIWEHYVWAFLALTTVCAIGFAIVLAARGAGTGEERFRKRVRWQDRLKRLVGCIALGGGVGLLLLAIPFIVEAGRDSLRSGGFASIAFGSSLVGIVTSMAGLQRFLPGDGESKRPLLLLALCLLGIGSLYALLILLENYVVYGNPLHLMTLWMLDFFAEPAIYFWIALSLVVAMAISCICRGFQIRPWWAAAIPVCTVFGSLACLFLYSAMCPSEVERKVEPSERLVTMRNRLGEITRPLRGIADSPLDVKDLPESLASVLSRLRIKRASLDEFWEFRPEDYPDPDTNKGSLTPWSVEYFGMAQDIADEGCDLLDADETELSQFRRKLAAVNRLGLYAEFPSETNGDELNASDLLYGALVRGIVDRLLADDERGFDVPNTLDELADTDLIETTRANLLRELVTAKANAGHQAELAGLLQRENEIDRQKFLNRKTVSAYGSFVPLRGLAEEESDPKDVDPEKTTLLLSMKLQNAAFDAALVEHVVSQMDETKLKTLSGSFSERLSPEQASLIRMAAVRQALSEFDTTLLRHIADAPTRTKVKYENPEVSEIEESDLKIAEDIENQFELSENQMASLARDTLIAKALNSISTQDQTADALIALGKVSVIPLVGIDEMLHGEIYALPVASNFDNPQIAKVMMAKFAVPVGETGAFQAADNAVLMLAMGTGGDFSSIKQIRPDLAANTFPLKLRIFLLSAAFIGAVCFCIADINTSSMHGYYRNQLARAFFLQATKTKLGTATDVKLSQLGQEGSKAPYTIINTALNMQASRDLNLRDRKSDFFVFTKRFCGGDRTEYVKTVTMENASPKITLGTAMAISAAAVAPNMGRNTNGFVVLLMTLFNARLGFWVPNPKKLDSKSKDFGDVFKSELENEITRRWNAVYGDANTRQLRDVLEPNARHDLVGLAFSGGGIRSAALNLGISQALQAAGVFDHVDYLSTVSGGGYTGSSIAVAMRRRPLGWEKAAVETDGVSEVGQAAPTPKEDSEEKDNAMVVWFRSLMGRWRLPEWFFAKEMTSCLHDGSDWVNLSDGGHIENLATIELLRRRCRFIIIGDGEADSSHTFNGVGTLIRLARLELGAELDLDLTPLRIADGKAKKHYVVGTVTYRGGQEKGTILYLKSSLTGDEDELIREYRNRCESFPHEPTLDQFFGVGQFEAYRALGQHIAEMSIEDLRSFSGLTTQTSLNEFSNFKKLFEFLSVSATTQYP